MLALEQHARDKDHKHTPAWFCPTPGCGKTFDDRKTRDKHYYTATHPQKTTSDESESEDEDEDHRGVSTSAPVRAVKTRASL